MRECPFTHEILLVGTGRNTPHIVQHLVLVTLSMLGSRSDIMVSVSGLIGVVVLCMSQVGEVSTGAS